MIERHDVWWDGREWSCSCGETFADRDGSAFFHYRIKRIDGNTLIGTDAELRQTVEGIA